MRKAERDQRRAVRGVVALLVSCAAVALPVTPTQAIEASFYADATVRPSGAVALVGDSTTFSYFDGVPTAMVAEGWGPFRIEARSGRRTVTPLPTATSGIDAVRRIRAGGFDPPVWVVALGTNDINVAAAQPGGVDGVIATMLGEIGSGYSVVWVNIYSRDDPVTTAAFNAALDRAAAASSNVRVADWHALAAANAEWFYPDGIHTNITGAVARNAFVARAAHPTRCNHVGSPAAAAPSTVTNVGTAASSTRGAVRLCGPTRP